jgi:hypothetical protein
MRVKIGDYKNWYGPYQLAKTIMFWVPDKKDEYDFLYTADRVHRFGEWLAHGSVRREPKLGEVYSFGDERPNTWIYKLLLWIDKKKKRKIKVHIDKYDTWNMETTLGYIVRPMLKQLRAEKHGAPQVELEDVPENLRPNESDIEKYKTDGTTDDLFFKRWDWVMDEMIFAFESLDGGVNEDWEEQFTTGNYDLRFKKIDEKGTSEMIHGSDHTAVTDWDGRKAYAARIQNGFRLFGKYYSSLWD